MNALEVRDVSRWFGGIKAVAGVSFTIERAEIVGIIGPNGSGKSTLFNLLAGVQTPATGTITLLGREITGLPPYRIARAGIGAHVPDSRPVHEHDRAREPAHRRRRRRLEGARPGGRRTLLRHSTLRTSPATSPIRSPAVNAACSNSRGCRCAIPPVILLDEVTAGVNPRLREIILGAVLALRERGKTFIVIEHDMELVNAVRADHCHGRRRDRRSRARSRRSQATNS